MPKCGETYTTGANNFQLDNGWMSKRIVVDPDRPTIQWYVILFKMFGYKDYNPGTRPKRKTPLAWGSDG